MHKLLAFFLIKAAVIHEDSYDKDANTYTKSYQQAAEEAVADRKDKEDFIGVLPMLMAGSWNEATSLALEVLDPKRMYRDNWTLLIRNNEAWVSLSN